MREEDGGEKVRPGREGGVKFKDTLSEHTDG